MPEFLMDHLSLCLNESKVLSLTLNNYIILDLVQIAQNENLKINLLVFNDKTKGDKLKPGQKEGRAVSTKKYFFFVFFTCGLINNKVSDMSTLVDS